MRREYNIAEHSHRFAAWAASRAASVKGSRFTVKVGQQILQESGFSHELATPNELPDARDFDVAHRQWRQTVIEIAKNHEMVFSHGVAAKLINVYLKSRFTCAGCHDHPKVLGIHPPIDAVLLDELRKQNVGDAAKFWKKYHSLRWSKWSSDDYESVISELRTHFEVTPLWQAEQYWSGYQQ